MSFPEGFPPVAAGEAVLCRVTRGATKPHLFTLRDDPRLAALKDLADEPLVYRTGEGDGVAGIYEQPGMAEGLGDLPWHRDCGMGAFNAHHPSCRGALPGAHFRARPGDVTLHYGDTIHAAPPPTDPGRHAYRISAIVGFSRPDARHHRGDRSDNEALHRREDGQVEHLVNVAQREGG